MTASESIFDTLRADILGGVLAPGDALPAERQLAEDLSVNRHAVREAVKRLQQAGLVKVAQGGSTRVLDWRESGGLDLLADLPLAPGEEGVRTIRSVLEMRMSIGVDAARRAAQRATAGHVGTLRILEAENAAAAPGPARERSYRSLWSAVVDSADNLAYRLAFNGLVAGVDNHYDLMLGLLDEELADLDTTARLVEAIAGHDPEAAAAAAQQLLGTTCAALMRGAEIT
jgi:GntR family transcriptional regulator, transcriptional repressor for pyruvate dehydrogenase complex